MQSSRGGIIGTRSLPPGARIALRRALLVAGLVAVAALAWNVRRELAAGLRSLDGGLLALSYALGIVSAIFQALIFGELLASYAEGVTRGEGSRTLLASQVAKYIPGRVWALFHQAAAVPASVSTGSLLLVNADLFAAVFLQVLTIAVTALWWPSPFAWLAFGVGLAVSSLGTYSRVAGRSLRRLGWLFRGVASPRLERAPRLAVVVGLNAACLATNLAASILLLRAILPTQPELAWPVLSAYAFATAFGSLVVLVPAGVGVREYLAIAVAGLVAVPLGAREMGSLALLVRCWQVAIDLAGVALATLLAARARRSDA